MRHLAVALSLTAVSTIAIPALAAPRVATDIAPVHSLTAQVMAGIGEPDLIMQVGASPHGYSMRPSEAAALQDAEIVFWIGESLTPWLERSLETVAADAQAVELLGAGASNVLPTRTGATFEAHDDHDDHDDHGDEEKDHADEHGDDHADHKDGDEHDDEHAENEHGDEHAEEDHHDHGGQDPHAWLSPENGKAWLDVIAATLSKADPANADAYAANAAAAKARLDVVSGEISAQLAPVHDERFIVFHDAYQYFETRFDMPAAGAISLGDAQKPSPARIVELQELAAKEDITCVFAEPQFNAGVIDAVFGDTNVGSGVLDPLGASLEPGAGFYEALLTDMSGSLATCLSGGS